MTKLNPHIELNLYRTNPGLWAVIKVFKHKPELKKVIWRNLSEADRKTLIQAVEDSREA